MRTEQKTGEDRAEDRWGQRRGQVRTEQKTGEDRAEDRWGQRRRQVRTEQKTGEGSPFCGQGSSLTAPVAAWWDGPSTVRKRYI